MSVLGQSISLKFLSLLLPVICSRFYYMRSKLGIQNLGIGKFLNEEFGVMNMRIESAEMGLSELYESILFVGGSSD